MSYSQLQAFKQAGIIYTNEKEIRGFFDEFRFLSNFHICKCSIGSVSYMSTEHAYMAAKAVDKKDHDWVASAPNPLEARNRGRVIALRDDWEEIKIEVMYQANLSKYQNPLLRGLLEKTGDRYLEETNWWNDFFWGVCRGKGENNLGKVLMRVRADLGISPLMKQLDPSWKI